MSTTTNTINTIKDTKKKLGVAVARYREIVHTANGNEVKAASDVVKQLRAEIVALITKGAQVCPICKNPPHGIEHPREKGGAEYEIGCLVCKPIKHDDGTIRQPRVRGGMLPQHAVDAWNSGPDFWNVAPDPLVDEETEAPASDAEDLPS
ncbi:MAG: hypothetical protein JWM74_4915 [Myxococcaceae bacterium]|nr:hypothetical protein [Myxococcaceae bacterium]